MTFISISTTMIAIYDTYQSHCQVMRISHSAKDREKSLHARFHTSAICILQSGCESSRRRKGKTPVQPHRATLMPFAFLSVLCRSEILSHGCMALAPIPCCCRM